MDPERRTLDDDARAGVPGAFVRLADGVTHYELAGPDTGRVVVLAAAFSVPAFISDSLYQRLVAAGFRVLRFDYYAPRLVGSDRRRLRARPVRPAARRSARLAPCRGAGGSGRDLVRGRDRQRVRRSAWRAGSVAHLRRPGLQHRSAARARGTLVPAVELAQGVPGWGWDAMARSQVDDFLYPERHPDWVARYSDPAAIPGHPARRGDEPGPPSRSRLTKARCLRRLGAQPRPVLIVWGRQDSGAPVRGQPRAARRHASRHVRSRRLRRPPVASRPDRYRGERGGAVSTWPRRAVDSSRARSTNRLGAPAPSAIGLLPTVVATSSRSKG